MILELKIVEQKTSTNHGSKPYLLDSGRKSAKLCYHDTGKCNSMKIQFLIEFTL